MPILTVLHQEAQEKELNFADRLFNLLQRPIENADRHDRRLANLSGQMAYLKILTEVATQDERFGFSD